MGIMTRSAADRRGLAPTAIRNPLDTLLDEAAEKQLTLREALAVLFERGSGVQGRTAPSRELSSSRTARAVRELVDFSFEAQPRVANVRCGNQRRGGRSRAATRCYCAASLRSAKTHLAIALVREAIR